MQRSGVGARKAFRPGPAFASPWPPALPDTRAPNSHGTWTLHALVFRIAGRHALNGVAAGYLSLGKLVPL